MATAMVPFRGSFISSMLGVTRLKTRIAATSSH